MTRKLHELSDTDLAEIGGARVVAQSEVWVPDDYLPMQHLPLMERAIRWSERRFPAQGLPLISLASASAWVLYIVIPWCTRRTRVLIVTGAGDTLWGEHLYACFAVSLASLLVFPVLLLITHTLTLLAYIPIRLGLIFLFASSDLYCEVWQRLDNLLTDPVPFRRWERAAQRLETRSNQDDWSGGWND